MWFKVFIYASSLCSSLLCSHSYSDCVLGFWALPKHGWPPRCALPAWILCRHRWSGEDAKVLLTLQLPRRCEGWTHRVWSSPARWTHNHASIVTQHRTSALLCVVLHFCVLKQQLNQIDILSKAHLSKICHAGWVISTHLSQKPGVHWCGWASTRPNMLKNLN